MSPRDKEFNRRSQDDNFHDQHRWLRPGDRSWVHPSEVPTEKTVFSRFSLGTHNRLRSWLVILGAGCMGAAIAVIAIEIAASSATQTIFSPSGINPGKSYRKVTHDNVILTSKNSSGGWSKLMNTPPATSGTKVLINAGRNLIQTVNKLSGSLVRVEIKTGNIQVTASGVVITNNGMVVTASSVLSLSDSDDSSSGSSDNSSGSNEDSSSSEKITVVTSTGTAKQATIVGNDPNSGIAVLHVPGLRLPPVSFSPGAQVQPGEFVFDLHAPGAVSAPLTNNSFVQLSIGTVTRLDNRVIINGTPLFETMVTDIPLENCSMGGILLNPQGEIIGLVTAYIHHYATFATPSTLVVGVAKELTTTGHVVHGWLGIEGHGTQITLGNNSISGVEVTDVDNSSAAQKAGIKPGALITSIDNMPVSSMSELQGDLYLMSPNQQISVGFIQNNQNYNVNVDLAFSPQ
ncbi:MAG: S1C family serine protease [Actinobacteria bacterium]|nr:S1C family serine protease [Actinomycetota bacterium]MCL6104537.1 S1C family serine protease [Actinomycetota bacterium]